MSDLEARGADPFAETTPGEVAGMAGLGVARSAAGQSFFPVGPAEAFGAGAGLPVEGGTARAILGLDVHPGRAAPVRMPPARHVTIEPRRPPRAWRRGVPPLPPARVREERLFVLTWSGVAPADGWHGEVGMLDPESVYASREGIRLPDGGTLAGEAGATLEELSPLMADRSVESRLRLRIAQLARWTGVGTPAGIRMRLALTHVQWPLLVGAPAAALAAAFERLVGRGLLIVEGRSLVIPWEAWPRLLAARPEPVPYGARAPQSSSGTSS